MSIVDNYAIGSTPLIHGPNMMANFRRMAKQGDFDTAIEFVAGMLGNEIGLAIAYDYLTETEKWMNDHTQLSADGETLFLYPEGIPGALVPGSGVTQDKDTEESNPEEK